MESILLNASPRTLRSVFFLISGLLLISVVYCNSKVENVKVLEGIPPGSILLTLPAKHGFRYVLMYSSSNGASLFHVSPGGIISTTATLDYESDYGYVFDLVIVCRENNRNEGGIATNVRITVLDVNDNTPKFPKDLYTATVSENSPANTYLQGLEGVYAQDADSALNSVHSYSITAGNEAGLFAVEMNENAGVKFLLLKTTSTIDREKNSFFVLTVQVKDNGTNALTSETQIRINILDKNDCEPLFHPPIYSLSVNENTALGTSVLQVKAIDEDDGRNGEVYYYFTKEHKFFGINVHTGVVVITSQLSFEQGNYFELNVVAIDRGSVVKHNSTTLLKIRLKDVIGFPPNQIAEPPQKLLFKPANYYVKIREDLPVGAEIVHVRTAGDGEYRQPYFVYELFPSKLRDTFKVNPRSGVIRLLKPLDFESTILYTLTIRAKRENPKVFIAETQVRIEVTDVDENIYAPEFRSNTIVKNITPYTPKNIVIERISATDKDKGRDGMVRYSIAGGTGAGRFFLDEEKGILKSFGSHNIQPDKRYDLHIEARDTAIFPRLSPMYLLIIAGSKNQKRPYFLTPSMRARLQENSNKGSYVTAVKAEFKGQLATREEEIFEYSINSGNKDGRFSIGKHTGIIHTTMRLDRESKSEYALDILARIKGQSENMSTLAQVVVTVTDVNDNAPTFIKDNFEVKVKENQGPIDNLLCLIATDADIGENANLTYSILSGNSFRLFYLHPTLGVLSVRDSLDFEKVKIHDLKVQVKDGGIPVRTASANVKVIVEDANDPPVFVQREYEVSVDEDAQPGNTLTVINATDEDSGSRGQLKCTIDDIDADEMDTFNFRTVSQGCALTLSNYLEHSYRSEYSFKVRATDQADSVPRRSTTAIVNVRVRDGNNNYPNFPQSSYWISLPEDTSAGTVVLTIKATDLDSGPNAAITYESSDNDVFPVHTKDGKITLRQRATPNMKYEFTITASDKGSPRRSSVAKVFVSVHSVSDSPPSFRKNNYMKIIPEDLKVNAEIIKLEAMNGAGSGMILSYHLVGGDPKTQFRIDSYTGWISLRQPLDYEKIQEYRLVVRVVQQGWSASMPELPAETIVTIKIKDVNDNAPRFAIPQDPFLTSVDQYLPSESLVTKLTAYDSDSSSHGMVKYSIQKNARVPFKIDRDTGMIRTNKILKYSEKSSYTFVVKATDITFPYNVGKANIIVHVRNVSPPVKFKKKQYKVNIAENAIGGRRLLTLNPSYQGQETLQYAITHGNERHPFCVDVTGDIRLRERLDREEKVKYELKISVKSGSLNTDGPNVIVRLSDINDNAPTFSQPVYKLSVQENLKGGYEIGTIRAKDPDKGENSRLIYSIVNYENTESDRRFDIDLNSGIIKATTTLDRETLDQHVITVRAEDAGSPRRSRLAHVVIIVQDDNDHIPMFSSQLQVLNIPLNSRVNAPIVTAIAHDADRDANGALRYSIVAGNDYRFFIINQYDGVIRLVRPLEDLETHHLRIQARDLGLPVKKSSTNIRINVYAIEGPPRFPFSRFTGRVKENVAGPKTVMIIKASSLDPITYSIVSGNDDNKFELNPGTGRLTVMTSLDHEEKSEYNIVVMATDLANRISKTSAIVEVVNVNDNFPAFLNIKDGVIEGSSLLDVSIGSTVMSVKAIDRDKDDKLTYAVDDVQAAKFFTILPDGSVKTKRVLRGFRKNPVVFRVGVRDNGRPANTAFALARLALLKYQLQQKEHKAKVSEVFPIGSRVTNLRPSIYINNAQYSIVSPLETSFEIDTDSGDVTLKASLDYETQKTHRFIAKVQNDREIGDYTNIDVVVNVIDSNDNRPNFTMTKTDDLYLAHINVNPNPDTFVYKLNATDIDSGQNSEIRYRMFQDRDGYFDVHQMTGVITTKGRKLLLLPWYNITVAAYDLGRPSLTTKAIINVKTGEYRPLFSKTEYNFYVDENTPMGITVGEVNAKSFSGATLWYEIIQDGIFTGNDNGKFVLDSNTGSLTLPNPLDYEVDSNIFHLKIKATETAITPSFFNIVTVKIYLRDSNDNSPEFVQQRYRDTLPESAPVGTTVVAVTARDRDSGVNGQFRYIADNDYFSVDPYTGWITTKRVLDYETIPRHAFHVVAQDGGNPARNGTTRVIVELTNVNDNKPVFSKSQYYVFVAENAAPGQIVATVQAADKDLDDVKYSILSGENTTNFVIDSKTGVVRLAKARRLGLKGPYYVMNISATDGMHLSKALLVVAVEDVNNHKPVFKDCDKYKPRVSEHLPARTFVLQVKAQDEDSGKNGEIEYSITKTKNSPHHFTVDRESGIVTTLLKLDREVKSNYQLHITARDGGSGRQDAERLMGFCQINVEIEDKNDNPPVFQNKHYEASIREDFDVGRSVIHISANDKDAGPNALISYSFNEPSYYFAIDNVTGTVTTKAKLAGSAKAFPLRVVARDNGNPRLQSDVILTITVLGNGNDPPVFDKSVYVVTNVREDVSTSHSIITVKARANNKQTVYYSIVPGNLPWTNDPKRFQINTISGEIQTSHALDYETTPNFTLTVRAETTSNPPGINFATVKIFLEDVNDNPPEFDMPRYQGHVSEFAPKGTTVIQVNADDKDTGDNGRVTFSFIQRNRFMAWKNFSLDKKRGIIRTKGTFDRETRGRYTFVVAASDHGIPAKISTTIVDVIIKDENDNPPIFEQQQYNISLFEDISVGTDVIKVSATDKDLGNNAKVSYQITNGNTGAVFQINREFGTITVASSLDREIKGSYRLEVTARDGKNSGRATVNVIVKDINDNDPKFEKQTYTAKIYEQEPKGTHVLTLIANDPDMGLGGVFRFSLSGQGKDAFEIDPKNGILKTRKELDRERKSRYDFLVFAVDAPGHASRRTGSADVTVIVKDINDNRPEFPDVPYVGHVQENLEAGASVIMMTAVDNDDPDEGGNAKMQYELLHNAGGVFQIDRNTGLIRTTRRLDRESKDMYVVKVGATDMGEPPQEGEVNVTIMVDDANDQRPKFVKRVFRTNVSESADPETTIATLLATDNDEGINAKLRYSIEKGNKDREFRIDEDTGRLVVAKSLNYETTKSYKLQVKVRDSGVPSYSDKAAVHIEVLDANDNPPVFKPVSYSSSFEEDTAVGTRLQIVTATDVDTGIHKEFRYSIAEGDPDGLFRIDPKTGEIFLEKSLDRETRPNHILSVRADNIETSDSTKVMYGKASVSIDVLDINDNGPHFKAYILNPSIPENLPPPVKIVKIVATDPDSNPKNRGPFKYQIIGGNERGYFNLTEDGVLMSNAEFDREEKAEYRLEIWGIDNGIPPKGNRTTLTVHIEDVNDHPHEAAHLELLLNSYQNHFKGGHIGNVIVTDVDTEDEKHYTLVKNDSDIFTVEYLSGAIISKPNPPEGLYSLTVSVKDRPYGFERTIHSVESTVKIRVRSISDEAVKRSVAVRISGKDRETFIRNYIISFKESVAGVLSTTKEFVDLFSIQDAANNVKPAAIDVRFAVHGSPYYAPEKLIAILKENRKNFDTFKVVSIGLDPCQAEPCKYGSCRSELRAPGTVDIVKIDDKSFTSIDVHNVGVCEECHAGRKAALTCADKPCKNGGTCQDTASGYQCKCPPIYNGKNCELTTRSFKEREFIWLPSLRQCRSSAMTLEFATKQADGLILYAGPTSHVEIGKGDVSDFLSIELEDGRARVSVSLGNRKDVLTITVPSSGLNDGKWHHLEVFRNETLVRVTVDKCKDSIINEGYGSPIPSENTSMCEVIKSFKNQDKKFLNLNGPLQLGGISSRDLMYPSLKSKDYIGCIRNLINDDVMYDLSNPSNQVGSEKGCPVMDKHCVASPCHGKSTCIGSWNGYKCHCPVGQHGDTCWASSQPVNYPNESLSQYLFSDEFLYDSRETKIELRFRTRNEDGGVLIHSLGTEENEYSSLELVREKPYPDGNSRLVVVYSFNLGDGEAIVRSKVNVGDGKWIAVHVIRYRDKAKLVVEKEAVYYESVGHTKGKHNLLTLDPIHTYIGGIPRSINARRRRRRRESPIKKDFVGCIDDVRLNGYRLHINGTSSIGTALTRGVTKGCTSISCRINSCASTEWCYDAWRKHICFPRMCMSSPCKNNGMCVEGVDGKEQNKFRCVCTPEFQGSLCEIGRAVVALRPDIGYENGLIIGISILLVVLIISSCVVVMYIKRSRRDSYNVTVEEVFKRDNVADYHIDGGIEEDVDQRFGDFVHVHPYDDRDHYNVTNGAKTRLLDQCGSDSNRSDKGYGGSSDASPTFILLRPVKNNRKSSPSPSGKSSEDEYYHYGRAVAVDLTNKSPKSIGTHPLDPNYRDHLRISDQQDKFHITTNPLNEKVLDRDMNRRTKTPEKKPNHFPNDKRDDVKSSSSDEGFASPMTHSPPSSQDDYPTRKLIKPDKPKKTRTMSPRGVSNAVHSKKDLEQPTKNPMMRGPVCIIRDDIPFHPAKNIDAGSDPDVVSPPPEKVASPGDLINDTGPQRHTPNIRLHEPPNDTSENKQKKPKDIPGKKFQNGIPDIPDDFPPPYEQCDDFPPPPREAYACLKELDSNKRPKNPVSTPHPSNFLPQDTLERFSFEGGGSPSGSLSSLGSDSPDDVTWASVNEFGDRFRKLAGMYGMPPSVSFSPHDEIIE